VVDHVIVDIYVDAGKGLVSGPDLGGKILKIISFQITGNVIFVFNSFKFSFGIIMGSPGMEFVDLITRVIYTVAAVRYLFVRTAFPDITKLTKAELPLAGCKASIAVDVFRLKIMFILLAPLCGNFSPGIVIIFLGSLICWAFIANKTTICHYLLHMFTPFITKGS
jgi:hypothetical protein